MAIGHISLLNIFFVSLNVLACKTKMKYKHIPLVHLVLFTVLITPDLTQLNIRSKRANETKIFFSEIAE